MDAETVRAMLEQQFEHSGDPERSHAMYREDAVLEFPQSGERFEGLENFREWRSQYPAQTKFEIGEIRGGGDVWVVELTVSYDEGPKISASASTSSATTRSPGRRSTSRRALRPRSGEPNGAPRPRSGGACGASSCSPSFSSSRSSRSGASCLALLALPLRLLRAADAGAELAAAAARPGGGRLGADWRRAGSCGRARRAARDRAAGRSGVDPGTTGSTQLEGVVSRRRSPTCAVPPGRSREGPDRLGAVGGGDRHPYPGARAIGVALVVERDRDRHELIRGIGETSLRRL